MSESAKDQADLLKRQLALIWNAGDSRADYCAKAIDALMAEAERAALERAVIICEEIGRRWDAGTGPRAACFAVSNELRALIESKEDQ